jgi:hypothetical protein
MLGHAKVGELRGGVLTGPSIDVFERGAIQAKLRPGLEAHRRDVRTSLADYATAHIHELSDLFRDNWFRALRRILLHTERYGHGGAYLITDELDHPDLDIKYKMNYSRLPAALVHEAEFSFRRYALGDHIVETYLHANRDTMDVLDYLDASIADDELRDSAAELNGVIRFISLLSRVDGAVLLTPRLDVVGFGVEIQHAEAPHEVFRATQPSAGRTSLRHARLHPLRNPAPINDEVLLGIPRQCWLRDLPRWRCARHHPHWRRGRPLGGHPTTARMGHHAI